MSRKLSKEEFYELYLRERNPCSIAEAPDEVKDDKELVLKLLHTDTKWKNVLGASLKYFSSKLRDDEEVVEACINLNPKAIQYASDRLRNDRDLALKAMSYGPAALACVGQKLLDDKQFAIDAYRVCGTSKSSLPADCLSPGLRDDEEVALQYLETGYLLKCFSDRIRDNEKLCRYACKSSQLAFSYTSERLRDDADFAKIIAENDGWNLQVEHVSDRLKADPDFVRYVCSRKPSYLIYFADELKDDRFFISCLCAENYEVLNFASERLKQDRDLVWPIVQAHPDSFRFVSTYFDDDDEMAWHVLQYVQTEGERSKLQGSPKLCLFSDRLRDNRLFVQEWVKVNGHQIAYASDRLREDMELCRAAMDNGADLNCLGEAVRGDFELVLKGVLKDGEHLKLATEELRNNMVIALAAIHNTMPYHYSWRADDFWGDYIINVFEYVGDELKKNEEFARIVIKAFMKTYYKDMYDEAELMKDPCKIFEIISRNCEEYEIYMDSPKEVLDLSDVLFQYGVDTN